MVGRILNCLFHRFDNMVRRRQIGIPNSQIDDIDAFCFDFLLFPVYLLKKIGWKPFQSVCFLYNTHNNLFHPF